MNRVRTSFNVSSKGWCFLRYGVPITILGHWDPDRPQGKDPLLASLTPLVCETSFAISVLNFFSVWWESLRGLERDHCGCALRAVWVGFQLKLLSVLEWFYSKYSAAKFYYIFQNTAQMHKLWYVVLNVFYQFEK